jgi:hypothetical protein
VAAAGGALLLGFWVQGHSSWARRAASCVRWAASWAGGSADVRGGLGGENKKTCVRVIC